MVMFKYGKMEYIGHDGLYFEVEPIQQTTNNIVGYIVIKDSEGTVHNKEEIKIQTLQTPKRDRREYMKQYYLKNRDKMKQQILDNYHKKKDIEKKNDF